MIHECIQGSEEWHALRAEHPFTASKALSIATCGDGLETLVWTYLANKYSQGDKVGDIYENEDMKRGKELEPQSRSLYELETGNTVKQVGFVTDENYPFAGVSPDGLVNEDGLFETKAPTNINYYKMLVNGVEIKKEYLYQMQMQMLFTGRKWCDFVVYNPNYSPSLLMKRVEQDTEIQQKIIPGLKKGEEMTRQVLLKTVHNSKQAN